MAAGAAGGRGALPRWGARRALERRRPAGAFALDGRAPSRAGERIRVRKLRGSKIARAVAGRWPSPVVGVREAGARCSSGAVAGAKAALAFGTPAVALRVAARRAWRSLGAGSGVGRRLEPRFHRWAVNRTTAEAWSRFPAWDHALALTPVSPPKSPAAFPDLRPVRPKTAFPGGKRKRWKDLDGTIYEWDYRHGTLEAYNPSGAHLGEFDPNTGEQLKDPDPTRRIEP